MTTTQRSSTTLTRAMNNTSVTRSAPRPTRQTVAAAREIVAEVMLAELETEGIAEFARHAMQTMVGLDDERLNMAGGDPVLGAMLGTFEVKALQQIKRVQANLFTRYP